MNDPIVVNLNQAIPSVGLNAADAYASGLAIQNQANGIIAQGGSYADATSLVNSALQSVTTQGANSPYYVPANANSSGLSMGQQLLAAVNANNPLAGAAAVAAINNANPNPLAAVTPSWLSGLTFARVAVVIVGVLMLLGSMMMFATDKSNVMPLVTSAAKEPELLA